MTRPKSCSARQFIDQLRQTEGLIFVHFRSALASDCDKVSKVIHECAQRLDQHARFFEVELESAGGELYHALRIEWVPTVLVYSHGTLLERFDRPLASDELADLLIACVSCYGNFSAPGIAADKNNEKEK
ncbi:MAG: thioredoxin family protein [Planctomycetota bacterium]